MTAYAVPSFIEASRLRSTVDFSTGGPDYTEMSPFEQPPCRRAALAAFACVGFHLLASAATLAILRPGLPPVHEVDRLAYLAGHAAPWRGAWLLWTASALTFLLFTVTASHALGSPLGTLAAGIAAFAGLIPDVAIQIIYMVKYPGVAAASELRPGELRTRDAAAAFLSAGLANGLYTTAWAILAGQAFRTPGFPRPLAWAALPGLAAGAGLTLAGFANAPRAMIAATATVIPLFTLWCLAAGLFFWKKAGAADRMSPRAGP
jgi:hypothetical protein